MATRAAAMDALTYSLVDVFEGEHEESEVFHEFSKMTRQNFARLAERVGTIQSDPKLVGMMARSWKTYVGSETVHLPPPSLGAMTVEEAVLRRRSVSSGGGAFGAGPVTVDELGAVLAFSYGPTREIKSPRLPNSQLLRATTSAGGLYPLEIYPLVFDCEGLAPGIYHYRVVDHALEILRPGSLKEPFLETTTYVQLAGGCAVALVVTAVFQRTLSKYLHRGYRFLMNDVGALLQSFYLTGTALELGTCALGGFFDDELAELLSVDGTNEAPVVCFLLGRRADLGTTA